MQLRDQSPRIFFYNEKMKGSINNTLARFLVSGSLGNSPPFSRPRKPKDSLKLCTSTRRQLKPFERNNKKIKLKEKTESFFKKFGR